MRTTNRIAPQTHVAGTVHAHDELVVEGHIVGDLSGSSTVTVAQDAIVEANVHVRKLVVHGVVVGHIAATESVHVGPRAQVRGDIRTPQLTLEEGGRVRGRVKTSVSVESARPPRHVPKTTTRPVITPSAAPEPHPVQDDKAAGSDEKEPLKSEAPDEAPADDAGSSPSEDTVASSTEGKSVEADDTQPTTGEVVEVDDDDPEEATQRKKQQKNQPA